MYPAVKNIPHVSSEEMRKVDRLMIEKYGINLFQMMENAGRNLADFTASIIFNRSYEDPKILVLAGSGGNGGGVAAAARRLHNRGFQVFISASKEWNDIKSVPGKQFEILNNIGVKIEKFKSRYSIKPDLILDGILGYSINGSPAGNVKAMIDFANRQKCRIISLDMPSGIDPDKGSVGTPCIRADFTLTIALPKQAFRIESVRNLTGDIYLCDISVPNELYRNELKIPGTDMIFHENDIIRVKY